MRGFLCDAVSALSNARFSRTPLGQNRRVSNGRPKMHRQHHNLTFTPEPFERLHVQAAKTQLRTLQMRKLLSAAVISAACVLVSFTASAAIKHHRHHQYDSQAAAAGNAARPRIACTITGCIPVPPGCHAEMGRTPNGTPTSFDVVVCGSHTLYGNR